MTANATVALREISLRLRLLGKAAYLLGNIALSNKLHDTAEELDDALRPINRLLQDGSTPLPDFLDWIADRLVNVHGESPNVDFVLSLRERAAKARGLVEA